MKVLAVTLFALVAAVASKTIESFEKSSAFNYHEKFGIPLANQIRAAEVRGKASRITGGSAASLGQYPYQAGLIIDLSLFRTSVCGGCIVSATKVLTAAHCWFDGIHQGQRFTVVAGSVLLFSGGQRLQTTNVQMHANWDPNLIRNDIAMISLPSAYALSTNVQPISLPTGNELNQNFAGVLAVVSGFGRTSDISDLATMPFLNHVNVSVITNAMCQSTFGTTVQPTNICTSGVSGMSPCPGDSGGPLAVTSNNRRILVGIVSFGSSSGCTRGYPAVYVRVTSYDAWIRAHL